MLVGEQVVYVRRMGGYPWRGARLAPDALRACLDVEVPAFALSDDADAPRQLADLDARTWDRFTDEQCRTLAELVVARVREQLWMLVEPGPLARRRLPLVEPFVALDEIGLNVRTYNALARTPLGTEPDRLFAATFADILAVRGLGAKALIELLAALEEEDGGQPQSDGEIAPTVHVVAVDEPPDPDAFAGGLTPDEVALLGAWYRFERDRLPPSILRKRLPAIPEHVLVDDLGLSSRTSKAIMQAGHAQIGVWLQTATLEEILRLRPFGRTGVEDLVNGVVRLMLQGPPDAALTTLAQSIAELGAADLIASDDPRLRPLTVDFSRADESLRLAALRFAERTRDPADVPATAARLQAILPVIEQFDALTVEDELLALATSVTDSLCAAMAGRYFGWDGRPRTTIQVVGDEFGLTREQARHAYEKVELRLRAARPWAPVLRRTLASAAGLAPAWADDVAAGLRDQQLTALLLDFRVLVAAAEMLDVDLPIILESVAGRPWIGVPGDDAGVRLDQRIKAVRRTARRAVENWGAARISDVVSALCQDHEAEVDLQFVVDMVTREPGFQWLDDEADWFWNADLPKSRAATQIDKILCVAGSLHIAEVLEGVARHCRMEGDTPPLSIFAEFCRRLPDRVLDGDTLRAEPAILPTEILADNELLIYNVLADQGGVMGRLDLEEACRQQGMNLSTFNIYIGTMPFIVNPRRSVYALVGTDSQVVPDAEMRLRRRRGRVLLDSGRIDEHRVWVLYRVSESMLGSGAFSVPVALREQLEGEYALRNSAGEFVGRIGARDFSAWGIAPYLRQTNAQVGQYVVVTFDVQSREAVATLGDEALRRQFLGIDGGAEADDDDDELADDHPVDVSRLA